MLNESVKHCPTLLEAKPDPAAAPLIKNVLERVTVAGPVMTKVSKSNRIWQMFSLQGQTFAEHCPAVGDVTSK